MINYNHLFYFFTVARLGGILKAAQYLNLAQPSLTVQIKALEANINRSLFKKVGRGLALTPDGEALYSICRRMFQPIEDLHDFLQNKDCRIQKTVRVGVADELERPFVVNLIRKIFRKELMNHNVHFRMQSDKHRALLDQLCRRELDVLLSNRGALSEEVAILAEIQMPIIAVANRSILKNDKKNQAREPLGKLLQNLDLGLVVPTFDHKLRIETENHLQNAHIQLPVIFESDIPSAVVRAAIEGIGVAFLPKPYVQNELKSGTLIKLSDGQSLWHHSIYQLAPTKQKLDLVNTEIQAFFSHYKENPF